MFCYSYKKVKRTNFNLWNCDSHWLEKFSHTMRIYTYQNLELVHVRIDVTKVGSWTLHVRLRVIFVRRTRVKTCKIKESDAQVSIWVKRIRESMYKRVCKQMCMCVGYVQGVWGNLVPIKVSGSCESLFLGVVTTYANNYRLVGDSQ